MKGTLIRRSVERVFGNVKERVAGGAEVSSAAELLKGLTEKNL